MTLNIFDFENYKEFVQAAIARRAKGGVGQLTALAKRMNVTPPVLSQVFRGSRHLTSEQALETACFLHLTTVEIEYFMALVEYDRAGTPALKEYALARAERAKKIGHKVKTKISQERQVRQIGPEDKAQFYSDWLYSAVRLVTAIPGCHSVAKIAKKLEVPESHAKAKQLSHSRGRRARTYHSQRNRQKGHGKNPKDNLGRLANDCERN